jgi:hypothetical protein
MTRFFVLLAVLMLALSPAWAAPKDKKDKKDDNVGNERRPSGSDIADEAAKAKFEKGRAIEKKYKNGDIVRFVPADRGKNDSVGDFARGAVLGILDIDRKGDQTGLPAGKYHVYVKQVKNDWMSFYEKDGHIVKDAVGVHYLDPGSPEPKFKDGGDCVNYMHWEFCY